MNTTSRRRWIRLAAGAAALAGCRRGATRSPSTVAPPLFAAPGGQPLSDAQAVAAMAASDIVLIGEQHDHAIGLDLAATLFAALLAEPRGAHAGLAFESLTRDQQGALDAHLRGELDEAGLLRATGLTEPRNFPPGHRRMLAAARAQRRPVLAANAPRELVKQARLVGLEPLRELPADQRALVDVPETLTDGPYRDAFMALMHSHAGVDEATREGFYRAQNVWDATMAGSLARGSAAGTRPLVQVVGAFHVDGHGGLYQRLRAALPEAKIWRLSMVAESHDSLQPDDRARADAVAYVGPAK